MNVRQFRNALAVAGLAAAGLAYCAKTDADWKSGIEAQRQFFAGFDNVFSEGYAVSSTNVPMEAALHNPEMGGKITHIRRLPNERYHQDVGGGCSYFLVGPFEVEWEGGERRSVYGHVSFLGRC